MPNNFNARWHLAWKSVVRSTFLQWDLDKRVLHWATAVSGMSHISALWSRGEDASLQKHDSGDNFPSDITGSTKNAERPWDGSENENGGQKQKLRRKGRELCHIEARRRRKCLRKGVPIIMLVASWIFAAYRSYQVQIPRGVLSVSCTGNFPYCRGIRRKSVKGFQKCWNRAWSHK